MQKRKLCKFFLSRIFITLPFSRLIQETFKTSTNSFILVINKKFYVQQSEFQFKTQYKYNAFFINSIQFKGLNSRDFLVFINVM